MPEDSWDEQGDAATEEATEQKVDKPRMYKVLLHNDNYTTMEFVIYVLTSIFRHSESSATRIMLAVHMQGVGVAGIYQREIAEMKVDRVVQLAREAQYPLQSTMEPE